MQQADLSAIKARIDGIAGASSLARRIRNVVLEADEDEYGSGFLRVTIELDTLRRLNDAAIGELVSEIEDRVGELDQRFPSVRFAEAA